VPMGPRKKAWPAVVDQISTAPGGSGGFLVLLYLRRCVRAGKQWVRWPASALPPSYLEKLSFRDWELLGARKSSVEPTDPPAQDRERQRRLPGVELTPVRPPEGFAGQLGLRVGSVAVLMTSGVQLRATVQSIKTDGKGMSVVLCKYTAAADGSQLIVDLLPGTRARTLLLPRDNDEVVSVVAE
jgi:hypothetical protein